MSGKFMTLAVAICVTGIFLVGCDGDPAPTVDWYLAHKPERDQKLAECNNDPGHLAKSPACVNAAQADLQEMESGPDAKASGKGF